MYPSTICMPAITCTKKEIKLYAMAGRSCRFPDTIWRMSSHCLIAGKLCTFPRFFGRVYFFFCGCPSLSVSVLGNNPSFPLVCVQYLFCHRSSFHKYMGLFRGFLVCHMRTLSSSVPLFSLSPLSNKPSHVVGQFPLRPLLHPTHP